MVRVKIERLRALDEKLEVVLLGGKKDSDG
jgi:hypothetical protein